MPAESPAFDVARERARQPACEAWFFFCLSFIVAHLFLFPVFAGAALWYLTAAVAARVGVAAWVAAAAAAAAYAATYFDGAEASGRRLWPSFSALWAGCHPYFPVRVLIWDADSSSWQSEPVPGHARTLPLAQRTHLCVGGVAGAGARAPLLPPPPPPPPPPISLRCAVGPRRPQVCHVSSRPAAARRGHSAAADCALAVAV